MPEVVNLAPPKYQRFMVYGWGGAGKTTLATTGGKKTLIIRPNLDHIPIQQVNTGAKMVIIRTWDDAFEQLDMLRHQGHEWDWVWLDNISLWQDVGLDDVWAATLERKPTRKEFGLDKLEYGINMERLQQWVRHMVGGGEFNLGITAHPNENFYDPVLEQQILMPWVQGKNMATKICGYMTTVAYYAVRTKEDGSKYRILLTEPTDTYFAKDQNNGALHKMVNPTMPKIEAAIAKAKAAVGAAPGNVVNLPRRGRRGAK